jgi:myo-inositol 2-dehydrogenase/D-chiro-inositol 1-dehydrogenase
MTVRLGFIGCGNHATQNLYPSLRYADCEVVAACDLWEERREKFRRAYHPAHMYEHFEPMLANADLHLDAVIVCGPPALHHEAGLAAMRRGLHVLTEKPPSDTLAQALEMQRVSRETGRICMVAFMKRFAQKYREAMEISARPEFGRRVHCLVRYSYGVQGEPHSILTGMAIHPIDLMHHFMGNVVRLQVERGTLERTCNFSVNLRFESGATGTLILDNTIPSPLERLELSGDGAFLVVDEVAHLAYYPKAEKAWAQPKKWVSEPNTALQTPENDSLVLQGYAGEVQAFIEAVAAGHAPACSTIDDGVEAMRLVELIEKAGSGTWERA